MTPPLNLDYTPARHAPEWTRKLTNGPGRVFRRAAALRELTRYERAHPSEPLTPLEKGAFERAKREFEHLSRLAPAVGQWIQGKGRGDRWERAVQRGTVLRGLVNEGVRNAALPLLVRGLFDSNEFTRRAAFEQLLRVHHPLVPTLIQEAFNGNYQSRHEQFKAFEESGAPMREAIATQLLSHFAPDVRSNAASFLGTTLRSPRAVPHLAKALNDKDADVLFNVAQALAFIKSWEAVETLAINLNHRNWQVRLFATKTVAEYWHAHRLDAHPKVHPILSKVGMVGPHFQFDANGNLQERFSVVQAAIRTALDPTKAHRLRTPHSVKLFIQQLRALGPSNRVK